MASQLSLLGDMAEARFHSTAKQKIKIIPRCLNLPNKGNKNNNKHESLSESVNPNLGFTLPGDLVNIIDDRIGEYLVEGLKIPFGKIDNPSDILKKVVDFLKKG